MVAPMVENRSALLQKCYRSFVPHPAQVEIADFGDGLLRKRSRPTLLTKRIKVLAKLFIGFGVWHFADASEIDAGAAPGFGVPVAFVPSELGGSWHGGPLVAGCA